MFKLLILSTLMSLQAQVITKNIVNDNLSNYWNNDFIEIDSISAYDYGVSYDYNYLYPEEAVVKFKFIEQILKKVAFKTRSDGSILKVGLYMEMYDVDKFYQRLVDSYGKPEIISYSKYFLDKQSINIFNKIDSLKVNKFESLPEPKIEQYKYLRNINWYFENDDNPKKTTSLIVRSHLKNEFMDLEVYSVEVIIQNRDAD